MKIIRPENTNEFKKEIYTVVPSDLIDGTRYGEKDALILDGHEVTPFTDETAKVEMSSLDILMQQTIDENKIKVEITLTKRQYELWNKKGGEKWLKKKLVGQKKK